MAEARKRKPGGMAPRPPVWGVRSTAVVFGSARPIPARLHVEGMDRSPLVGDARLHTGSHLAHRERYVTAAIRLWEKPMTMRERGVGAPVLARGQYYAHGRPTLTHQLRQTDTVNRSSGHIDVAEHQAYIIPALENPDRLVRVCCDGNIETSFPNGRFRVEEGYRLIFDDQNDAFALFHHW